MIAVKDKKHEDYLDDCMSSVLIVTMLILSAVNIIPSLISHYMGIPHWIASLFTGTTLLMCIGVFYDIICQAEFFKAQADSGVKGWAICYTAFDEFEAKIKTEFLRNKGMQALSEPLRYTWGMPVRTMVDQYRIYVPSDKKELARNLLVI